jgi:hypothetical protein
MNAYESDEQEADRVGVSTMNAYEFDEQEADRVDDSVCLYSGVVH